MVERAAHLVDAVLSCVPVRQWVLTLPLRLRYRLAWDHDLCRAVVGVFLRAVFAALRRRAAWDGVAGGRSGAVTILRRRRRARAREGGDDAVHRYDQLVEGRALHPRGGLTARNSTGLRPMASSWPPQSPRLATPCSPERRWPCSRRESRPHRGLSTVVAPDGRFLINTELGEALSPSITVVHHWRGGQER
jgi:hypothetical protein